MSFEQLVELRTQTETIAQLLCKQLQAHLETLRPLLPPRRLLGKYVSVKEDGVEGPTERLHSCKRHIEG